MHTVLTILLFVIAGTTAPATQRDPRAKIIEGVRSIACPGLPGPLCVFGDAIVIVSADVDGVPAPIIATGRRGKGHLVALGHEGYFSKTALETADTRRLMTNLIEHAASGRKDLTAPIRVAHMNQPGIEALASERCLVMRLEDSGFPRKTGDVDVLIIAAGDIGPGFVDLLDLFVQDGGAVIAGVPGWGWKSLNPEKKLPNDLRANWLFERGGITWADGTIDVPPSRTLVVDSQISPLLNASAALSAIRADEPPADLDIAIAQLMRSLEALPAGEFANQVREATKTNVMSLPVPSAERPITNEIGVRKLQFAAHVRAVHAANANSVRAERAAELFPGEVWDWSPRVTKEITIDPSIPGWQSTGLYAPSGETIRVWTKSGVPIAKIRIGAHSDQLWHLSSWKRAPQVDREFDFARGDIEIANGFGGLIYVIAHDDPKSSPGGVFIEGAVESPYFMLGKTKSDDWKNRISKLRAPWAELQSEKIIITIPSEHVRNLDDPTDLLKFWDRVADACADLTTIPRERKRPERYVADVQISAGYMHAGYPIMTHLDAAPRFVDLTVLQRDGDWGMFHEIGHNHQSDDWTFDGTSEVTVNLFTMYVLDTVCANGGKMHKAMSPESRAKMEAKYKANGTKFEDWKRDPFLALCMYKQLQEAFGWDAYRRVFLEYQQLADDARPKTDDEKRDQWMVRFSRRVDRNLAPFFEYWGIPTSESARKSIENLPVWMPDSLKK